MPIAGGVSKTTRHRRSPKCWTVRSCTGRTGPCTYRETREADCERGPACPHVRPGAPRASGRTCRLSESRRHTYGVFHATVLFRIYPKPCPAHTAGCGLTQPRGGAALRRATGLTCCRAISCPSRRCSTTSRWPLEMPAEAPRWARPPALLLGQAPKRGRCAPRTPPAVAGLGCLRHRTRPRLPAPELWPPATGPGLLAASRKARPRTLEATARACGASQCVAARPLAETPPLVDSAGPAGPQN